MSQFEEVTIGDCRLILGDCQNSLKRIEANSIDSIVTDPPYGISFMGKKWDYDIPKVEVWVEALRVMKPGAHLLCFASPRTQHRMACNIEDAGFDIRDSIAWMYGQGMPKSGTLKPAHEPIIVARKPFAGTQKANIQKYGVGVFNVEPCRVPTEENLNGGAYSKNGSERNDEWGESNGFRRDQKLEYVQPTGRYPANIIHDGSDEVKDLFPENSPGCKPHRVSASDETVKRLQEKGWGFNGTDRVVGYDDGDDLSAARFFYCAKPSKAERNAGTSNGNGHPTVKPVALCRYLQRLVTPDGGITADLYAGSGSFGVAAVLEGFRFIGMEREAEYVQLQRERIAYLTALPNLMLDAAPQPKQADMLA